MQRLTNLRDDRGAVAVWVAILIIPLMIVAALAIDVSALHSDRQRLQIGADAAALAIAEDCARGDACADAADVTAQVLADANAPLGGEASASATVPAHAFRVEVVTESARQSWFAGVIGSDSTALAAHSIATWTGAGGIFPVALNWCELNVQAGMTPIVDDSAVVGLNPKTDPSPLTVVLPKKSDTGCTGTNGMFAPGNFGFLDHGGDCSLVANPVSGTVPGSSGNQLDKGCEEELTRWTGANSSPVIIPVFDEASGNGSKVEYSVIGYAVVDLDGYYFDGSHRSIPNPCGGSERCIRGTFLDFLALGDPDAETIIDPVVQLQLQ